MKSILGMILGFLSANVAGGLAFWTTFVAEILLYQVFFDPSHMSAQFPDGTTGFAIFVVYIFVAAIYGSFFSAPICVIPALLCLAAIKQFKMETLGGCLIAGIVCSGSVMGVMTWRDISIDKTLGTGQILFATGAIISTIIAGLVGGWIFRRVSNAVDVYEAERNERWQSSYSLRAQSQQLEQTIDKDEKSGELKVISNE